MTRSFTTQGFSMIEMLVAVSIMLVVTGAIFQLTGPAQLLFQTEPERADMQQRLRIGAETITKDLMMAGAGGQITGGGLVPGRTFATVMPHRRGVQSPDPNDAFFDDRISILYVPFAAAETTLSGPTGSTVSVPVRAQRGCPITDRLCGFRANQLVSVFDATGAHDEFRVVAVQDNPPSLIGNGSALSTSYSAGATVAEIIAVTYWLQSDVGADVHQLMRYDGFQTDSPVADNVTRLRFQYFGEPEPPASGSGSSLVALTAQQLSDGPWYPDQASPVRFDRDLLRIRRVRVTLQVRASRTFVVMHIPDLEVGFDVAPRNLNLAHQ